MTLKNICIVSGLLLILAIPPLWPYGFYTVLRFVIFGSSIVVAYKFYQSGLIQWSMVFGAIAFIFNPILPVYLSKDVWVVIDFISALIFIGASKYGKD